MARSKRGLSRQGSSAAPAASSTSPTTTVPQDAAQSTTAAAPTTSSSYLPTSYLPSSYLPTSYLPTSFSRLLSTAPTEAPLPALSASADALLGPLSAPAASLPLAPNDALVRRLRASPASRDAVLHQFLRARAQDPAAAAAMLRATLVWRRDVGIARFLREADTMVRHPKAAFPMRRVTQGGEGKKDMLVYGLVRLMDKALVDKERFLDATTAFLEDVYEDTEYVNEPINAILDFGGWSVRRHAPYAAAKAGINLLNAYYPDRLGKVFCVRYPSSIRVAYNVIRPLLDSGAREKIVFVDSDDPATVLRQHLSPESLPVFCGGTLDVDFGPKVDLQKEWRENVAPDTSSSASAPSSYF